MTETFATAPIHTSVEHVTQACLTTRIRDTNVSVQMMSVKTIPRSTAKHARAKAATTEHVVLMPQAAFIHVTAQKMNVKTIQTTPANHVNVPTPMKREPAKQAPYVMAIPVTNARVNQNNQHDHRILLQGNHHLDNRINSSTPILNLTSPNTMIQQSYIQLTSQLPFIIYRSSAPYNQHQIARIGGSQLCHLLSIITSAT